jgi:hypothetical protein
MVTIPLAYLKQSGDRAAKANAMTDAALSSFIFYLGIGTPSWLNFLGVPAFINRRRFERLKRKFPRARQATQVQTALHRARVVAHGDFPA